MSCDVVARPSPEAAPFVAGNEAALDISAMLDRGAERHVVLYRSADDLSVWPVDEMADTLWCAFMLLLSSCDTSVGAGHKQAVIHSCDTRNSGRLTAALRQRERNLRQARTIVVAWLGWARRFAGGMSGSNVRGSGDDIHQRLARLVSPDFDRAVLDILFHYDRLPRLSGQGTLPTDRSNILELADARLLVMACSHVLRPILHSIDAQREARPMMARIIRRLRGLRQDMREAVAAANHTEHGTGPDGFRNLVSRSFLLEALAQLIAGNAGAARQLLERASAEGLLDVHGSLLLAWLIEPFDPGAAIASLRHALGLLPGNIRIMSTLAEMELVHGSLDEAVALIEEVLTRHPELTRLRLLRARALAEMDRDDAEQVRSLLDLDLGTTTRRFLAGRLMVLGQREDALGHLGVIRDARLASLPPSFEHGLERLFSDAHEARFWLTRRGIDDPLLLASSSDGSGLRVSFDGPIPPGADIGAAGIGADAIDWAFRQAHACCDAGDLTPGVSGSSGPWPAGWTVLHASSSSAQARIGDPAEWIARAVLGARIDALVADWLECRPERADEVMSYLPWPFDMEQVPRLVASAQGLDPSRSVGIIISSMHLGPIYIGPLLSGLVDAPVRWVASSPVDSAIPWTRDLVSTVGQSRRSLVESIIRSLDEGASVIITSDGAASPRTPRVRWRDQSATVATLVPRLAWSRAFPSVHVTTRISFAGHAMPSTPGDMAFEIDFVVPPPPSAYPSQKAMIQDWTAGVMALVDRNLGSWPENLRLKGGVWRHIRSPRIAASRIPV